MPKAKQADLDELRRDLFEARAQLAVIKKTVEYINLYEVRDQQVRQGKKLRYLSEEVDRAGRWMPYDYTVAFLIALTAANCAIVFEKLVHP